MPSTDEHRTYAHVIVKALAAVCFVVLGLCNHWRSWRRWHKLKRTTNNAAPRSTAVDSNSHFMKDANGEMHNLRTRSIYGVMIVLGLVFSLMGDLLLALDYPGSNQLFFPVGTLCFLVAHFCYIVAFIYNAASYYKHETYRENRDWRPFCVTALASFIAALLVTKYVVLGYVQPGSMRILCACYTCLLSLMVAFSPAGESFFVKTLTNGSSSKSATNATITTEKILNLRMIARVIGAILFFASDMCVAVSKFIDGDVVYTAIFGLPMYFNAQLSIAMSLFVPFEASQQEQLPIEVKQRMPIQEPVIPLTPKATTVEQLPMASAS